MLPWKLQKRQILPVNQDLSSVYFSLAKFQLVSCNLSLAMIWQVTFTHKLPKPCSATLIEGVRFTRCPLNTGFTVLPLHAFLVCKFFIRGKMQKIELIFFFHLKTKQSAQSRLTSCQIEGVLEGYSCWRRR